MTTWQLEERCGKARGRTKKATLWTEQQVKLSPGAPFTPTTVSQGGRARKGPSVDNAPIQSQSNTVQQRRFTRTSQERRLGPNQARVQVWRLGPHLGSSQGSAGFGWALLGSRRLWRALVGVGGRGRNSLPSAHTYCTWQMKSRQGSAIGKASPGTPHNSIGRGSARCGISCCLIELCAYIKHDSSLQQGRRAAFHSTSIVPKTPGCECQCQTWPLLCKLDQSACKPPRSRPAGTIGSRSRRSACCHSLNPPWTRQSPHSRAQDRSLMAVA